MKTIEKYLQGKVNINEITESDRDLILNQLDMINIKNENINVVLCLFLVDLRMSDIVIISELDLLKKVLRFKLPDFYIANFTSELKELLDKHILIKLYETDKVFYKLNKDYIDELKNNETEKSTFNEMKDEAKEFLHAHFEAYQKYDEIVLNDLGMILTECFNFETKSDNGLLHFEMGGCGYDCYLSRGYIILEENGNRHVEDVWNADSIEEFIDLINDLKGDE